MSPFVVNGDLWRVIRVGAGDPRLVDRTGRERLATTDPSRMTVWLRSDLMPPILDKVLLHEVAHAVTISWGLLRPLGAMVESGHRVGVEEWSAQLMENHAIEAVNAASTVLGRPVCVMGECLGTPHD